MLSGVMAALLAFAAIVQFNDPDAARWVAVYAASSAVSIVAAAGRRVPPAVSGALSLIALTWAAAILAGGPAAVDYLHMFDAWEMKSIAVEEAREASGLLIAGGWLAVLMAAPALRG
jgi:hypothetical protein